MNTLSRYTVAPSDAHKLEAVAAELFPNWKRICNNFLRHKICMISPQLLARLGIPIFFSGLPDLPLVLVSGDYTNTFRLLLLQV